MDYFYVFTMLALAVVLGLFVTILYLLIGYHLYMHVNEVYLEVQRTHKRTKCLDNKDVQRELEGKDFFFFELRICNRNNFPLRIGNVSLVKENIHYDITNIQPSVYLNEYPPYKNANLSHIFYCDCESSRHVLEANGSFVLFMCASEDEKIIEIVKSYFESLELKLEIEYKTIRPIEFFLGRLRVQTIWMNKWLRLDGINPRGKVE